LLASIVQAGLTARHVIAGFLHGLGEPAAEGIADGYNSDCNDFGIDYDRDRLHFGNHQSYVYPKIRKIKVQDRARILSAVSLDR
jgi:hypothetical protein